MVGFRHSNGRTKRTYGWDCPYYDYTSNRHYNTQRHIDLIHGIGLGEPVDHSTGETREEKKRAFASDDNHNRSINMLAYPRTRSQSPVINPINYPDTPGTIRMPFLEAQGRRVRELGYTAPSLSLARVPSPAPMQHPHLHNYEPNSGGWTDIPCYRHNSLVHTIENTTNHYSANTCNCSPPNSPYHTIGSGRGPLDDWIRFLLHYENLRRSFRWWGGDEVP